MERRSGFEAGAAAGERVRDIRFGEDRLIVDLPGGRTIAFPFLWLCALKPLTSVLHPRWLAAGGGYGIHWPDINEVLSTSGSLRGAPWPKRAEWRRRVADMLMQGRVSC